MDDRRAQFLISIAQLCQSAELASLQVELLSSDGSRMRGIPVSARYGEAVGQLGDAGPRPIFWIDDHVIDLSETVECTIRYSSAPRWRS
jgi:hypothetical protein